MTDESITISAKTWARSVDSIHKVRYSDGIVDGEKSAFQTSFDMGYEEGFSFGFFISSQNMLRDTLQDNCIICSDNVKLKDNVTNLYNLQKDTNKKFV
ncbi:unnamed protein product [Pieris brassicae]|uniref:Essential protein Yae1 N-terminal domain-containing protein n=1 Tax=Pieris brassicae TaxID=7116 RepID=A0A9P0XBG4_PIEBR|nr:unnamed protein product [Pieris brassicae]